MVCCGRWHSGPCSFRSSIGFFRVRDTNGPALLREGWQQNQLSFKEVSLMRRLILVSAAITAIVWSGTALLGFCGFYVAKADTKLFNQSSQVVMVRDGDHTVLTMANDFRGDPKEFAIVIP